MAHPDGVEPDLAVAQTEIIFADLKFSSVAAESIAAAGALALTHVVFANAAEYELLTDAVPASALRDVVVTDGPRPAQWIRSGRRVARALPPRIDPVDVTGSGDTVAGTFLVTRATGLDDAVALEWAMRAASAHSASAALRLDR